MQNATVSLTLGERLDRIWEATGSGVADLARGVLPNVPLIAPSADHRVLPLVTEDFVFSSAETADKWGFGDGDVFAEFILEWARSRGWWSGDYDWANDDGPGPLNELWPYLNHRDLLWGVWSEWLAPQVSFAHEVERIGGIHNPIRVSTREAEIAALNHPVLLSVTGEQVAASADRIFPTRSAAWLEIFCFIQSVFPLSTITGRSLTSAIADELEFVDPTFRNLLFAYISDPVMARSWAEAEELARISA